MRVSTHFKNFNEWKEAAKREGYTVRKIYDDVYHAYDKYGVQGEWGEAKDFGVIWTYTKSNPIKELKLFKYNKNTGIWDYVRSVTKENANQWLSVFSKDEPSETFKLSKYPPKMRMKLNPVKRHGSKLRFKDLNVGDFFVFTSEKIYTSMMQGPWEKTGNRSYKHAEKEDSPLYKIGSINAEVTKVNPIKRFGSRAKFKHKRLVSPKKFAKKSLRTIKRGKKRIIVGCPKGKYDVKRKVCRVGTRAQAVLTPKKNPKETLYFIHGTKGIQSGLYNEDRNSLTDKKEDATHFHDKYSANIIKRNLELGQPSWKWKIVPITFFEG